MLACGGIECGLERRGGRVGGECRASRRGRARGVRGRAGTGARAARSSRASSARARSSAWRPAGVEEVDLGEVEHEGARTCPRPRTPTGLREARGVDASSSPLEREAPCARRSFVSLTSRGDASRAVMPLNVEPPRRDPSVGSRRADVCAHTSPAGRMGSCRTTRSRSSTPTRARGRARPGGRGARSAEALARVQRLPPGLGRGGGARARLAPPRLPRRRRAALARGRRPGAALRGADRAGDVLRPWTWDEEGSHVQAEVGWRCSRRPRSRCSTTGSWSASCRGRRSASSSSTAAPGGRTTSRWRWRSRTTSASTTGCCSRSGTSPSAGARCTQRASSCRCRSATSGRRPRRRAPAVGHERAGRAHARGRDLAP